MSFKRLIIIGALPSLLAGCAEFYGSQPPAPIYGEQPEQSEQAEAPKQAQAAKKKSKSRKSPKKDVVQTQPLKDSGEIKTEALPLAEPVPIPAPVPLETAPMQPRAAETAPFEATPLPSPAAPVPAAPSAPPAAAEVQTRTAPEPEPAPAPTLTPFQPMESTGPLSPAVSALVSASNQNTKSGDLDSAAASIERAIRIEPRNATLFYKLALLRLKQSKPRLAEDLAKKSALLASTDNNLKKHCWLLVAHARELQQDFAGARQAREKADSF